MATRFPTSCEKDIVYYLYCSWVPTPTASGFRRRVSQCSLSLRSLAVLRSQARCGRRRAGLAPLAPGADDFFSTRLPRAHPGGQELPDLLVDLEPVTLSGHDDVAPSLLTGQLEVRLSNPAVELETPGLESALRAAAACLLVTGSGGGAALPR